MQKVWKGEKDTWWSHNATSSKQTTYLQPIYILIRKYTTQELSTIASKKLVISSHSYRAGVHFLNSSPLQLSYRKFI